MTIETTARPTERESELSGQTVVVIGGSAGIGIGLGIISAITEALRRP